MVLYWGRRDGGGSHLQVLKDLFWKTFEREVPGIKMIGYLIPFFVLVWIFAAPFVFMIVLEAVLVELSSFYSDLRWRAESIILVRSVLFFFLHIPFWSMGIKGLPLQCFSPLIIVLENPPSFSGALGDYSQSSVNCLALPQSFLLLTPALSLIPISSDRWDC